MSQMLMLDKFTSTEVPIEEIKLRPGAVVPGGADSVSRKLLQNLVRGTAEPILTRRLGAKMEIVAGDLEFLAEKKRGASVVKVLTSDLDDKDALLIRLSEGSRRDELNALEEAEIIRILNHDYGMTQQEIAMRTGKVQSTIANKLRLLKLPPEVQSALRSGEIGERHARALLKIDDTNKQLEIFKRAVRTRASAQEIESMCALAAGPSAKRGRGRKKGGRGVVKDIRIYQNGLRSVVREMQKAGLNIICEENVENGWEFKVLVMPEGESGH